MRPAEILKETRKSIREHAESDPDKWFYANRFVYARLQLDERKTKTGVKKALFDAQVRCHYCGESFKSRTGVHLHRVDEERGYSDTNCTLMHPECHRNYHAENPRTTNRGREVKISRLENEENALNKFSKRYAGGRFMYWWDFSPTFAERSKRYKIVRLVREDTKEFYPLSTDTLSIFLTQDRRTSRGKGNWGVKVFRDRPNELAFEPGKGNSDWLFLKIHWETV